MPKRPIKWHEESLRIWEASLIRQKLELESMRLRVTDSESELARLRSQIQRAKRLGKDGFDREKFQPEKGGER